MAYGIQNELLKAYGEAAQQIADRHSSGGNRKNPVTLKDRLKEVRRRLNMSQAQFADTFKLAFSTVKNWEQDSRGEPKGLADTYIRLIESDPETMMRLLEKVRIEDDRDVSFNKREKAE